VADAIISNPVSYAHAHCAEALGIPLHLMFPQVRTGLYALTLLWAVLCGLSCLDFWFVRHAAPIL
jgi:hypothetical protein